MVYSFRKQSSSDPYYSHALHEKNIPRGEVGGFLTLTPAKNVINLEFKNIG